jgi:transcriptional regulator with GAF, ATPase, and Fis domain
MGTGADYPGPVDGEREQRLADAFVELADTLVDDYDVLDFLHGLAGHCVTLLDVDAAGLMLADATGLLRVAASSNEEVRLLELFELQNEDGPCLECFVSGRAVEAGDLLETERDRWPGFGRAATASGFRSVVALPLRLRDETIGALNLFRVQPGALVSQDRSLAQAMADVATIGILQERGSQRREVLARQLQDALSSRIVIEQAKGVIAERQGVHVDAAFELLRARARSHGEPLSDVARRVVANELSLQPSDPVAERDSSRRRDPPPRR